MARTLQFVFHGQLHLYQSAAVHGSPRRVDPAEIYLPTLQPPLSPRTSGVDHSNGEHSDKTNFSSWVLPHLKIFF